MNEQLVNTLNTLALKLGTTAEMLWEVMMKQAPIYAMTSTFVIVLSGVLFFFLYKFFKKNEWFADEIDENPFMFLVSTVLAIAVACYGVLVLTTIPSIIYAIFNPEYWALMNLLGR
jgi:hypothetical protein